MGKIRESVSNYRRERATNRLASRESQREVSSEEWGGWCQQYGHLFDDDGECSCGATR